MANKRQELDSGYMGMLSEDHSAVANLPQEVVQRAYPKCDYMGQYLNDTIEGIDETNKKNIDSMEKHRSKSMY
jgi:hypothetical protein